MPLNQCLAELITKCALKNRDDTSNEEDIEGSDIVRLVSKENARKGGGPKCYKCGKPGRLKQIPGK